MHEQVKEALNELGNTVHARLLAQSEELKALSDENADLRERLEEIESRAGQPGRVGTSAESRARKAFEQYIRKNDPSLLADKSLSIAGGESSGSGMVPTIIAAQILSKAREVSPVIGEVLRTNSSSGDYKRIVNRKGTSSGWVGETGTRTATNTSQFRTISPTGGELYAYPSVSNWLLNDAQFDLTNLIVDDSAEEFGSQLERAILFGTGSNQPTGMLNTAPATTPDANDIRDRDTLRYLEASGSPSVIDGDLLVSAYFDLSASYRRNAIWVMSSATLSAVRKLKDLNGNYLWQPGLQGAVDSGDGLLLGKRVVVSELIDTSAYNVKALVGDFRRAYEVTAVGGMAITRDEVTTPGFQKWYVRARYLGRLIDNNAVRAIKGN